MLKSSKRTLNMEEIVKMGSFWSCLFIILLSHIVCGSDDVTGSSDGEADEVTWAAVGTAAHLPCDITTPQPDDNVYLVLWYKDESPQPVYSYDARGSQTKHWSEDHQFGSRAVFRTSVSPAQLILTNVKKTDSGVYKCRVDFRNSPTRVKTAELKCVEKAKKPVILDDEGIQVMGSVGPYRLHQPLVLICMGEGDGENDQRLVWYRNGQEYDVEMDPEGRAGSYRNTLVISSLTRDMAANTFTCKVKDSKLTGNPETSIMVNINMPVQHMSIENLPTTQVDGRTYEIFCQATGSSPKPDIIWYLKEPSGQNTSLAASKISTSSDGNITISKLSLTVDKHQHGSHLVCSVMNPIFLPLKSEIKLNVNYPPEVNIELPGGHSPGRIVEGTDFRMVCSVKSRPEPTRFLWMKDGFVLAEEETLVFKNVNSSSSGKYSCIVENIEGRGESSAVSVSILYRPTCAASVIMPHQTETRIDTPGVDLRCEVNAKPLARSYRWFFNSTGGSFEIPSAKPLMSFMNYAESGQGEHQGEVLCWATNDVGVQSEPCVFHVVPLGAPHPPRDCGIKSRGPGWVEVECEAGFSGGLEQHFVLEVLEMVNGSQSLVMSNWSRDPLIRVNGLESNTSYILAVHASNDRGESPAVYVGGQTASSLPSLPQSSSPDRLPLLYIIIAVLCAVMFLTVILSVTAACRRYALMKRTKKLTQSQPIISAYGTDVDQSEPLVHTNNRGTLSRRDVDRRVSFRECSCSPADKTVISRGSSNGTLNGTRTDSKNIPGPQRTIVRSYSIDKLRARCGTCNPNGCVPYPGVESQHLNNSSTLTKPRPPPSHPAHEQPRVDGGGRNKVQANLAEAERMLNNSLHGLI